MTFNEFFRDRCYDICSDCRDNASLVWEYKSEEISSLHSQLKVMRDSLEKSSECLRYYGHSENHDNSCPSSYALKMENDNNKVLKEIEG